MTDSHTAEKRLPTTSLEWVAQTLEDADNALAVLFTMLAKEKLRQGATVADEIRANVKTARKEVAHLLRATAPPPAPLADLMPAMCHGGNLGNGTMLLTVWAPKDYPIVVGSNYLVSVTQVREGSDETGGSR